MVELADTRGLICGFQLHENGTSEALNWDIASEPNRQFDEAVWLHFSLADVRAKKWISSSERIPVRAREILLDTDLHIRLERVERGFAGGSRGPAFRVRRRSGSPWRNPPLRR